MTNRRHNPITAYLRDYRLDLGTPALIIRPLRHLGSRLNGHPNPDGTYTHHPLLELARRWATAGRGDKVQALARQFA